LQEVSVAAFDTLVALLRARAVEQADVAAYTFVRDGDRDELTWTWGELDRRARAVAASLQASARPGDRVLVLFPQGLDYLAALFGCMYAGMLAIPLQPPGKHRAKSALPKLEAIANDGGVSFAVTTSGLLDDMMELVAASPALASVRWLATDDVPLARADDWVEPALRGADLAYLQYTSGSTSAPKGVMVSHDNLLYNLRDFNDGYGHDAESVMVSWLPTFHDLGLVYGVFMPLYVGFRAVLLDPLHFLARPMRWMEAFSRHRGTHGPSPNFAFDLVAAKSTPEERARLDLRAWKVALNGAEPIRYESELRFVEAFAVAGVTWSTLSHAYGMSEATACISKEWVGTPRVFLDLDAGALERHEVVPVAEGTAGARRVAGCGRTSNQTVVRVVDPDSLATCPPGRVGELWVGGPTCAGGYWNLPEATERGFRAHTADSGEGPYLRTGDLGFVHDGQVFVTGRLKDMIIIRGENHYPQDIEWSVQESHPAIRASCVAAFSLVRDGVEALGVVAEVYPERVTEAEAVFAPIRDAIGEHGLSAHIIALVPPRAVFKTSSGKVMRGRAREVLEAGGFERVATWTRAAPSAPASPADDLRAKLAAAPSFAREGLLVEHVLSRVGAALGLPVSALDGDAPLKELGLDSVQAVELADTLSRDLGEDVPVTSLFEHPTADALAAWLLRRRAAVEAPKAVAPPAPQNPAPAEVDTATDDELAALLRAELEDL
jgi:acyl-CoA synthetase (AMP-forming)/AMP-acid ligase II/aryl carrier-like protein